MILPRPDASLSCSFVTQGLFPPVGCISIFLFCSTGMISAARMHLYLALLLHRDYFDRPDASLSCFSVTQRLFPPSGCISILLFCYTGIISAAQIHPYPALFHHRDYFGQPNASLSCSFVPQGLFRPARCIPPLLFCSTEIISAARIHLYLALLLHRDYFQRPNASLSCSFVTQGLFRPARCIPAFLFCYTGIISTGRMHLYLALLFHRDYFAPSGCISILLFCSTGIISAARIHLYLPLLLHRDYFRRPDSSCSSQQILDTKLSFSVT